MAIWRRDFQKRFGIGCIETDLLPAAEVIDREVARDREQPRLKPRASVVLTGAFQHPHPGFLHEIFRLFTLGRQVHQVPQQTVMILRNQAADEFRVLPSQSACNTLRLGLRQPRKCHNHGYHTPCIRSWEPKLRMATHLVDDQTCSTALPAGVADRSSLVAKGRVMPRPPAAASSGRPTR